MLMNDLLPLALAMFAGAWLGAFYFGGLWWTVQNGVTSPNPALLFLASLLVRTAVILVGFYLAAQGHWSRLVACLVGFMIARVIVVSRLTRPPVPQPDPLEDEAHLAP